MMRRKRVIQAGAAVVVVAALGLGLFFGLSYGRSSQDESLAGQNGQVGTTAADVSSDVVHLNVSGSIVPADCIPEKQYKKATAVVVGEVTEILPLRQNIDERYYSGKEEPGYLPVYYSGFRVKVAEWFGSGDMGPVVTVYGVFSGAGVIDGKSVQQTAEFDPGIKVGESYAVPILATSYYGVKLEMNEYWAVGEGISIYRVDGQTATRAVPLEASVDKSLGIRDTTGLEALRNIARNCGLSEHQVQ